MTLAEPGLTFGIADHYVPTRGRDRPIADPQIAAMVANFAANAVASGISLFGLGDARQGIVHVVGPEQGLTLAGPSDRVRRQPYLDARRVRRLCLRHRRVRGGACADDADAVAEEAEAHARHVERQAGAGIAAKDIALAIIARIGADGAQGHAIEYAGSAIAALSMEGRMTLCNMSIEAGGRCGMVAPDATTFAYLQRPSLRAARSGI